MGRLDPRTEAIVFRCSFFALAPSLSVSLLSDRRISGLALCRLPSRFSLRRTMRSLSILLLSAASLAAARPVLDYELQRDAILKQWEQLPLRVWTSSVSRKCESGAQSCDKMGAISW